MRAKRKAPVDPRPEPFHCTIRTLGLRVVSYLNESVECRDGTKYWLPRDIVGEDGNTMIVHREIDRHYSIRGYEPWHDGMFGGRYDTIHSALCWVKTARDVRAGKRSTF